MSTVEDPSVDSGQPSGGDTDVAQSPPVLGPTVLVQPFTEVQQRKFEEQTRYTERVLKGWKERRADRRAGLAARAGTIRQALVEYKKIDRGDFEDVRIRTNFVRLEKKRPQRTAGHKYSRAEDLRTRPPLTRLINRKNTALRVLLSAIYVAHLEHEPGKAFTNNHANVFADGTYAPWWRLCGQYVDVSPSRTNREHGRTLNRALAMLDDLGLLQSGAGTQAGRYKAWLLNSESGDGHRYSSLRASWTCHHSSAQSVLRTRLAPCAGTGRAGDLSCGGRTNTAFGREGANVQ